MSQGSNGISLRDLLIKDIFKNKRSLNVAEYWNNIAERDPFLRTVCFTCDLIFGNGQRAKLSTHPITVRDENGATMAYQPALVKYPAVSTSYDFKGGAASQRSVNIEIDARVINPMETILSGSFLVGVGEIALQKDGGRFIDRYVLLRGDMTGGINFAADKETMQITLSDPKSSVDKIIPEAITTKEGFPTLPDDRIGFRFPLCLTPVKSVPTINLSSNAYGPTTLVAYGNNVNVTRVFMDGQAIPASDYIFLPQLGFAQIVNYWNQVNGTDALGNPWVGVEFVTTSTPAYEGKSFYAGVTLKKGDAPDVLQIIRRLVVEQSALGADGYDSVLHAKAVAKAGGALHAEIMINGSDQNNTATVFSYINSAICAEFPMLKGAYTGRGFGIIYTDRTDRKSVINLVRGQGLLIDRKSNLEESDGNEIFNSFQIRYNYDAMSDTYQSVAKRDESNDLLCRVSQARIGKREMPPVDLVIVNDDTTASKIVEWYANHYTLPSYTVTYIAAPRLYFLCAIGDNARITDDRLGMREISATITKMTMQSGKLEIEFRLWLQYDNLSV